MRRARLFALALVAAACTSAEPARDVDSALELDAPARSPAPATDPGPALHRGPMPSDVTEAERRDAVLAMLAGGAIATELPVRASDPGKAFDLGLADELTPTTRGPIPKLQQAVPEVEGPLHRDVVRRIIRAHMGEIRFCYNQVLAENPKARGELAFDFTIAADGTVHEAEVSRSTLSEADESACFSKAVKRWKYPKSDDGTATTVSWSVVLDAT